MNNSHSPLAVLLPMSLANKNADKAVFALVMRLVLVVAGSWLLWASAKFQVPFYPVPMTLQSMVVVLLGMTLGPYWGTAAVLTYLAQGAAGLPVFSGTPEKGIGLAYMAGPTGGYLVGFVISAFVAGWLAVRPVFNNIVGFCGVALLASALVYVPGLLWLSHLVGFEKAVQFGLTPFVLSYFFKAVLAACIASTMLGAKRKLI